MAHIGRQRKKESHVKRPPKLPSIPRKNRKMKKKRVSLKTSVGWEWHSVKY